MYAKQTPNNGIFHPRSISTHQFSRSIFSFHFGIARQMKIERLQVKLNFLGMEYSFFEYKPKFFCCCKLNLSIVEANLVFKSIKYYKKLDFNSKIMLFSFMQISSLQCRIMNMCEEKNKQFLPRNFDGEY